MTTKAYRVFPSVVAPILLCGVAVYLGFTRDYWFLCSVPFVVLGTFCAAPNLNLADGCLEMISMVVGFAIALLWSRPLGRAIFIGSAVGWIGGAVEKRNRMRPL